MTLIKTDNSKIVELRPRASDKPSQISYNSSNNIMSEGGGGVDWQEKYIDQLNETMKEIRLDLKDIKRDIEGNRKETQSQFSSNKAEIQTQFAALRSEMQNTNRWIIGLVVAASLSFLGIAISLSLGMVTVLNIIKGLVVK